MQILAISGSVRAASTNARVLEAAARLASASVDVVLYDGLETLPYFNPDVEARGLPIRIVSTAGTGTHAIAGAVEGVTEVQPGSYIWMDCDYLGVAGQNRPLNRRSSAPTRQQGRMDIHAAQSRKLQDRTGQDQAVCDDHEHIGVPRR